MIKKEVVVNKGIKVIDLLLSESFSYNEALKMLRNKDVRVNGVRVSKNEALHENDVVVYFCKEEPKFYEIVFDGVDALIVNKKAGIESEALGKILGVKAVHRLDRNTEGLLVFAKNEDAKVKLDSAFKERLVEKCYLAEVVGRLEVDKLFTAYLVKDAERSLVKVFDRKVPNSKKIETFVTTLKASAESSLVKVRIFGGKTHQIRAHLAHLGHAIIGDGKYGRREDYQKFKQKRQQLFAYKLKFKDIGIVELDNKEFKILPNFVRDIKIKID